LIEGSNTLSIF